MRSVIVTKPYHYEIVEEEIPSRLAPDEVLVKLKAVGVCGSDIHIFRGENMMARYPVVLGHENAGILCKTGTAVSRFHEGDRVVVEQTNFCGKCYPCSIGRSNVCEHLRVRGCTIDGGFREYMVCKEQSLYALPDSVSFVAGAMVEPFTIAAQCVNKISLVPEDTVLIFGVGTIGSTILQTCKIAGAKVIAADIDPDNLERAAFYGADACVNPKDGELASLVQAVNGGKGVMAAIDAACFTGSLTQLLAPGVVCNAGRVLCLGFGNAPEGISQSMLTGRDITLFSSRLQCGRYPGVIENFLHNRYQLERLVTDVIPFGQIDRVFENMKNPDPSVKKIVIVFD